MMGNCFIKLRDVFWKVDHPLVGAYPFSKCPNELLHSITWLANELWFPLGPMFYVRQTSWCVSHDGLVICILSSMDMHGKMKYFR
jgi:hypothetical protein